MDKKKPTEEVLWAEENGSCISYTGRGQELL